MTVRNKLLGGNSVELVEGQIRLLVLQKDSRVQDTKDENSNGDANTIKSDKVSLSLHQMSIPSLEELDRSVDASDVNKDDRYDDAVDYETLALLKAHTDELKDDTSDHEVGTRLGILSFVGCSRSQATTAGLDEEGKHIDDEEDPEIKLGTDDGVLRTDGLDEVSKSNVDGSSDKDRADDEGGDLEKEGNLVVGALVGPRSPDPANELDVRRDGQQIRGGLSLLERPDDVVNARSGKDKIEDNACRETGHVAVGVLEAWDQVFAAVEEIASSVGTVRYRHDRRREWEVFVLSTFLERLEED
ncbi:hypothetical protein HG530_000339 [Fusarium avenaceum]|nr:hypothetical protein HG530_000339 [Fusarium avenaceum]